MINYYKKLSLRWKLLFSFAVPEIIAVVICYAVIVPKIQSAYLDRVFYSYSQATSQGLSYIDSYSQAFDFILDKIYTNEPLNTLLTSEQFLYEKNDYENFQQIYQEIEQIQSNYLDYQITIYLPSHIGYTVNRSVIGSREQLFSELTQQQTDALSSGKGSVYAIRTVTNSLSSYQTFGILSILPIAGGNAVISISTPASSISSILDNTAMTENSRVFLISGDSDPLLENSRKDGAQSSSQLLPSALENSGDAWVRKNIEGVSYYVLKDNSRYNKLRLLMAVPDSDMLKELRLIRLFLFLMISMTIVIIVAFCLLFSKFYAKRLGSINKKIRRLQSGNISEWIRTQSAEDTAVSVSGKDEITQIENDFERMSNMLHVLLQDHYKLGKSVKNAELMALQAQINPHFLYNTLDLVNWIAMDYGADKISEITENLAKFYRLSLNKGKSILRIEEELNHIKAYVNIENYHFNNAIHLEYDIPEAFLDYACPNIIFQPFVENAILHGIASHNDIEECHIKITAQKEDQDLLFTISDDGPGIPESTLKILNSGFKEIVPSENNGSGYGSVNVNFRLQLYFGEKYGIRYKSREGEGTSVFIRIPMLHLEEMNHIFKSFAN